MNDPRIEAAYWDGDHEPARAYESGALAALDYIADERPDLEDLTMKAAEKIGRDIDRLLGLHPPRSGGTT